MREKNNYLKDVIFYYIIILLYMCGSIEKSIHTYEKYFEISSDIFVHYKQVSLVLSF